MSQSTRSESYNHENDDGPTDPGEGDPYPYPYPRRRLTVRPATLIAAIAGVLAVAFAVGGVTALLPAGQASGAARPVAQVSRETPSPRVHPRPAPKPTPAARRSPKPPARRKPVTRPTPTAPPPAPPATVPPIIVRVEPPPPAVLPQAPPPARAPAKAPAKPPAKAPAKPPAKAPAKAPVQTAPLTSQISGYVQCSTMAVEGVWIVAENGGSGWAKWTAGNSASTAKYSYTLPHGGRYAVHVGCGGSPAHWQTTPDSNVVSGTFNDFICYDVKGQSAYDFCSHIN
jgi:hypothetical protein